MSDEPESAQEQISRRRVLKGMAAAGAVAWATPVVQTVNMQRAWADNESRPRDCYRIKLEASGTTLTCTTGFGQGSDQGGGGDCLDPSSPDVLNTTGGCAFFASGSVVSNFVWTFTLTGNCEIVRATAKTGNSCHEVTVTGSNPYEINTTGLDKRAISHVELEICCEEAV